MRLKTKISVIEKEKEKLNRFVETAPEGLGKMSRLHGGLRISEVLSLLCRKTTWLFATSKSLCESTVKKTRFCVSIVKK